MGLNLKLISFFFYRYIYSGIVYLSVDIKKNVDLLIAADELCLEDLCSYIVEYIVGQLIKDKKSLESNFILVQRTAIKLNHFTRLSQFYQDVLQQNPLLIFRAGDFITIDKKILLDTLIKNHHSLKPIKIWDKVVEWCRAQSVELQSD